MTASTTAQVPVKCPQCYRMIILTAEQYADEDGDLYVDGVVVMRAIGIHMTYGCIAARDS